METVVTLAAYNEAKNIGSLVRKIVGQGFTCVVVDDGSSDATATIAAAEGARVVRHAINLGQGHALLTGLKVAIKQRGCEFVVEMDADGQHRPEEIPAFVQKMRETHADVVVGSRILGAASRNAPLIRRAMLPYVTWCINKLSGYELTDSMCGFRAFRRESLSRVLPVLDAMLEPQYIAAEMFIRFGRIGFSIVEIPVHIDQRSSGMSTKGMLRYGTGVLKSAVRAVIEARATP